MFHLDSETGFRGGERQLLYLACWLRAAGHENIVVCRGGSTLEAQAGARGLAVLTLPFVTEWDPISAALLRRRAATAALPPVLHAHTAHTAALAFLASRAGGPPWVVHRRVDFTVSALSRRFKYAAAGKVIAVSDAVSALLARQGVPASLIATVRDCIPATPDEARLAGDRPFSPLAGEARRAARSRLAVEWSLEPDAFWVGNLAALVGHKDQANLLRAAAAARARLPRARYLLVGEGPLRGELEALSRSLGLGDIARFTGRQEDPAAWLGVLDAFVLSSWGEGMGSVLLEAMACRVPVAATTAGGIPEVVADGVTGLLVPPRDPGRLADALCRLAADAGLRRRLADAAALRLQEFGVAAAGGKIQGIYEGLVTEEAAA